MLPKLALSIVGFIPLYVLMIFMYGYSYLFECNDKFIKGYIIGAIFIIIGFNILCIGIVNKYIKDKENLSISENEIIFKNIKEDKKAHIDYMMTYLLPLLIFDIDNINGFNILYTNLLIILFIFMNARAENFNFNIILWIKGYRVYKGIDSEENEKTLLIKKRQFSNIRLNHCRYKFVSFGGSNDIYLCRRYI